MESFIITGIKKIILLIVLIVWSIFGFLFWIPLLTRTTALYSFNLIYTMTVKNPQQYIARLQRPLNFAIVFYIVGFKRIFATMPSFDDEAHSEDRTSEQKDSVFDKFKWEKFLAELLWTIIFWAIIMMPFFL